MSRAGELKVGCLSWSYPDWAGSFYEKGTKSSEFLSLYSRVFDIVEVDSTFYRTPSAETVRQWKEKTPRSFMFATKLPKKISHAAKGKDTSEEMDLFQKTMKNFGEKLGCIVAQMPPYFKADKGFEKLEDFLSRIDTTVRFAVELRHASWYSQRTYDLLRDHKVCLVWAVNEFVETNLEPVATADFIYLRFRGEFNEFKRFDRSQSDKSQILKKWWDNLKPLLDERQIQNAFVLVSNHFEGFAPVTANRFREIAGLKPIEWKSVWAAPVSEENSSKLESF
jgi:uncharacterized protein YecE (DUF72 family)